jgi:hypothetical protein
MDALVLRRRFKNRESRAFLAAERKTRRRIRPAPTPAPEHVPTAISTVESLDGVSLNWPVGQSAQEFVEKVAAEKLAGLNAEQFEEGPLLTLSAAEAVAPATPEIPSWAQIMSTPGSWKAVLSGGTSFIVTSGTTGNAFTQTISYETE